MTTYRNTGWRCVKCGKTMTQASNEPQRLQPTLDPNQRLGYCGGCKGKRLFRREAEMR